MNTKLMVMIAFSVLVSSCGTTRLSTKDSTDIDSGKKVILTTYNQPLIGSLIFSEQPVTQIISIDGKKIPSEIFKTDESVAVEVGVHKFEFSCVSRSGYDERDYSKVIEINIKPHHEYMVRCSFDTEFGPDGTYTGSFDVKEKRLK